MKRNFLLTRDLIQGKNNICCMYHYRLEEQLIDGVLYAFQEQTETENSMIMLSGIGTVVNALGIRCKPYLPQVCQKLSQNWQVEMI
jgi:hypothetical protein